MFDWFYQQIIPGIYAGLANRKMDVQHDAALEKKLSPLPDVFNLDESLTQLKADFEKQGERKKSIEDKAKTIFGTISISVTAITFTLNYNNFNFKSLLGIISVILLILSIIYIIMGSIRAMQTINIRAFHVFQTDIIETEETIIVTGIGGKQEQLENLAKAKLLNDKVITKIANYAWASSILVRNGIILFATYFIFALLQKTQVKNVDSQTVSKADSLIINSLNNMNSTGAKNNDLLKKWFYIDSLRITDSLKKAR